MSNEEAAEQRREQTFLKQYERNEDRNAHCENVVLLAKFMRNARAEKLAKLVLQIRDVAGGLPHGVAQFQRDELHEPLWRAFIAGKSEDRNGGRMSGDEAAEQMPEMGEERMESVRRSMTKQWREQRRQEEAPARLDAIEAQLDGHWVEFHETQAALWETEERLCATEEEMAKLVATKEDMEKWAETMRRDLDGLLRQLEDWERKIGKGVA